MINGIDILGPDHAHNDHSGRDRGMMKRGGRIKWESDVTRASPPRGREVVNFARVCDVFSRVLCAEKLEAESRGTLS